MSQVRLAVVYYSTYGSNYVMAQEAVEAAREAGAEVRMLKVRETAPQSVVDSVPAWKEHAEKTAHIPEASAGDMEWANAYLFSAPTRFGTVASQLRAFIDTLGGVWAQGKLSNKAVSAMSSANNPHGGQEATLLGLYTTFAHWGCIIVPPGFTDPNIYASGGNPYGATHTVNDGPVSDALKVSIRAQVKRLVDFAGRIAKE